MNRSLTFLAVAAAAISLTACGSSDSDSTDTPTPQTMPKPTKDKLGQAQTVKLTKSLERVELTVNDGKVHSAAAQGRKVAQTMQNEAILVRRANDTVRAGACKSALTGLEQALLKAAGQVQPYDAQRAFQARLNANAARDRLASACS